MPSPSQPTGAPGGATRWPGLPDADRRVLRELLLYGAQSRVRLAERVGLSRTSLTRIARELVDRGLVEEGEVQLLPTRGRPAEMLHLRPEAAHFVGLKLTGDDAYVVLTDLAAQIVAESSAPLASREVDDVVALSAGLVAEITRGVDTVAAAGVAVAGDVAMRGGRAILERSGFLGWDSVPLAELVTAATGLSTTVVNDVHALTGAHHWFGGLGPHRSLVVYGVGAGIGRGVVLGDELLVGEYGRAGRIGHLRIEGSGRPCPNGHHDCVHSFVTMPSIEWNAGVEPGEYELALARARDGEPVAAGAFRQAAFALGATIADSINAFDPEIVSVMGEGVDMLALAPEQVDRALEEYIELGDPGAVRLETPPFHFDLYARGGAVAAMRELLS
ncbi:MAG: ROK family transcriptional regulator [Actinomycetales bacterium]|nr:ROK family transcriptional regulator [Actinomycetales bacterium]